MLIATMTYGDEDPDLHVHFTGYARKLDESDPVEFARLLRTFEEACAAYAARLHRARMQIEANLTTADDAPGGTGE